MSILITVRASDRLPIDVRTIRFDHEDASDLVKLARQQVWHGHRQVELGDLFSVSAGKGEADFIWQGDLETVHNLGARLRRGKILVKGNPGRHLGSEMFAGEIIVEGNVGDYAGVQMRGGIIRVKGNAGNFIGGQYAGEKMGMNRGTILINGNTGNGVGAGMRRGLIAVGGSVGRSLGWNMLAGNLVVFGACHEPVGSNMKRGTIILAGEQLPISRHRCPSNFKYSGSFEPGVVRLVTAWLKQVGFPVAKNSLNSRVFAHFAGDQLAGGRGEIFCRI